jgi:hypothetical protein
MVLQILLLNFCRAEKNISEECPKWKGPYR